MARRAHVLPPAPDRAGDFASTHFAHLPLGDRRRSRRAETIGATLAASPSESIPKACGSWAGAKAAYRFFRQHGVTPQSITTTHRQITRGEMLARRTVLLVQDTTEVSYGHAPRRSGLGPIGHGHGADGFLLHTALAIDPDASRAVLGVASLACWSRDGVRADEPQARRRRRPDRESLKWTVPVTEIGAPPSGSRWIHVCDREGDVYETFETCMGIGVDCLVRSGGAAGARKAALGHGGDPAREDGGELAELARSLKACGETVLERRLDGTLTRHAMRVACSPVTVFPPRLRRCGSPLRLWVVRTWESGRRSEPGLEWILLTTVPTEDAGSALRAAEWYAHRWTVEEYHKCLKTGCGIESRQLEDGGALMSLCAMLAVVATHLLSLRTLAAGRAGAPASEAVPSEYVEAMSLVRGIDRADLTCGRFLRELGLMGGHLGRRADGPPGWKTLMLGWRDLEMLAAGIRLARGEARCG